MYICQYSETQSDWWINYLVETSHTWRSCSIMELSMFLVVWITFGKYSGSNLFYYKIYIYVYNLVQYLKSADSYHYK